MRRVFALIPKLIVHSSPSALRFRRGPVFADDLVAAINALVADVHTWTGDELVHLLLALAAKRAREIGLRSWASMHVISLSSAATRPPCQSVNVMFEH